MKRTSLARKTGLARKTPLTARSPLPRGKPAPSLTKRARKVVRALEPGEAEWKRKRWGVCSLCQVYGRVVFHHIVDEGAIRAATTKEQQAAGIAWDPRNALRVGAPLAFGGNCQCHASHHLPGVRDSRIPFAKVSAVAREFAREILGEGPATEFFKRHYK